MGGIDGSRLRKLWHDPVWSKIVAAGIIAAIAWLGARFDWWAVIGRVVRRAWAFLCASSPVPRWLLGLLLLVAASVFVIVLTAFLSAARSTKTPTQAPWYTYDNDVLYSVCWRWRYGSSGAIQNLAAFCPRCDYQVSFQNVSAYAVIDRIAFHCDNCERDIAVFEEPLDSVESKVIRLIQQKIRNGTWESERR